MERKSPKDQNQQDKDMIKKAFANQEMEFDRNNTDLMDLRIRISLNIIYYNCEMQATETELVSYVNLVCTPFSIAHDLLLLSVLGQIFLEQTSFLPGP